ncbi:MAG TPA: hypothetical protein VN890_01140, partial [Methylocella sp.]|nr:hypothetical protein [Methylocella sp.]
VGQAWKAPRHAYAWSGPLLPGISQHDVMELSRTASVYLPRDVAHQALDCAAKKARASADTTQGRGGHA